MWVQVRVYLWVLVWVLASSIYTLIHICMYIYKYMRYKVYIFMQIGDDCRLPSVLPHHGARYEAGTHQLVEAGEARRGLSWGGVAIALTWFPQSSAQLRRNEHHMCHHNTPTPHHHHNNHNNNNTHTLSCQRRVMC